jgi:hypothetical protein
MDLFAIGGEALGVALFFAAVIAAVIVAFTLHIRLLDRQVRREQREQAAEAAALPSRLRLVAPAAPVSDAAQPMPVSAEEEASFRRAA